MTIDLEQLIRDIGTAIKRIDTRRPQAANARTGAAYQPGIGPHPETQAVALIVAELRAIDRERYDGQLYTDIAYVGLSRQKCDLCIGARGSFDWGVEIKMLRLMGDNGKPNDGERARDCGPMEHEAHHRSRRRRYPHTAPLTTLAVRTDQPPPPARPTPPSPSGPFQRLLAWWHDLRQSWGTATL